MDSQSIYAFWTCFCLSALSCVYIDIISGCSLIYEKCFCRCCLRYVLQTEQPGEGGGEESWSIRVLERASSRFPGPAQIPTTTIRVQIPEAARTQHEAKPPPPHPGKAPPLCKPHHLLWQKPETALPLLSCFSPSPYPSCHLNLPFAFPYSHQLSTGVYFPS